MPSITKQQAQEFLNNINEQDKIAIIHHDDLDGFASGILLYDFCKLKAKNIITSVFEFGKTDKEKLKEKLEQVNKIIFTDIASFGIAKEMSGLFNEKECLSIDHHKKEFDLDKNILDYYPENYIPASRLAYELIENKEKNWLALAGTISDAGDRYPENLEFIKNSLKELNLSLEDFKKQFSEKLERTLIYFDKDFEKAFNVIEKISSINEIKDLEKYTKKVDKEFNKYYKDFQEKKEKIGKINFYYLNPRIGISTILANKISAENPNEIFIFVKPSDKNMLSLSARHQNKTISMIDLVKFCIKDLENATGGGHVAAAGGAFLTKDLEKFKENLKNFSETIK